MSAFSAFSAFSLCGASSDPHFSRAAKRGCFKRGGFPIWTCPSFLSFFVLLGLSRGFSRFVRGLSGDFPDWSVSSFSAYYQHLRGTVPKGSATQSGPFPKKVGNTRVWKPPGLASLNYFSGLRGTFRIFRIFEFPRIGFESLISKIRPNGFIMTGLR